MSAAKVCDRLSAFCVHHASQPPTAAPGLVVFLAPHIRTRSPQWQSWMHRHRKQFTLST
eukprot:COSAG06_NODE_2023_length_7816_cov_52.135415_8_plen_59_part_00